MYNLVPLLPMYTLPAEVKDEIITGDKKSELFPQEKLKKKRSFILAV